jgi:hypothetical protein
MQDVLGSSGGVSAGRGGLKIAKVLESSAPGAGVSVGQVRGSPSDEVVPLNLELGTQNRILMCGDQYQQEDRG